MKAYVVYKVESDHARPVIDFLRDFEKRTGKKVNEVDPESPSGSAFCETYDIMAYPTIIATDDNGVLQNEWRGLPLPLIDEVSYYAN
ncbi:hypothetical protein A3F64_03015 [Candidatus Saccharibacteria bacterium RIFCSPHIGHO2_12_FULL_42_8]|nr:MAG: hypothetical protein A3F64_03015 [Candidatus Saccharibacteria bacterium RIFCSPHIGHO2_12_FULL_42_8]